MPNGVTFQGFAEFRRALHEMPARVQEKSGYITEDAGVSMGASLRADYPEGPTGNLRKGVRVEQIGPYSWRVRSTARHSFIFNRGTGRRRTKRKGANRGVMPAANLFIPTATRTRAMMNSRLVAMVQHETGARVEGWS